MKKIFMAMIATVLFANFNVKAQSFEESVLVITKGAISVDKLYAQTVEVKNFDPSLRMESTLSLNFVDFNDDGRGNDKVAGDGIYTSVKLYKQPVEEGLVFKSDLFKYRKQLDALLNSNTTSKFSIKLSCKVRRVHSGYTILGTDCATHWCVELYDCTVDVEFP